MSFLPPVDQKYLANKGIIYEELVDSGRKGVVFSKHPLPAGRFDATEVNVLVIMPPGYPDIAPDMFYLMPWVKLVQGNRYPKAADRPLNFGGKRWQRWSRHNSEWRAGIDGIWTMLKRIDRAIEEAA
ncbi:MAG TPA: E2/UBC family protein [Myxococcota bacterium]|nr:E2/UBC family protein [Myxococcota bacterium]